MWHDVRTLNVIANTLFAVFVLALLTAGARWLMQRPMFSLGAVHVQEMDGGELKHVNALTVRSVALPRIKGNFFTVDLDAVCMGFKAVPWVREATVRREWPNRLIVSIEEHKALGTWGNDGHLLSVKGDVFIANLAEAEEDGELLTFSGPKGSEKEVAAKYRELRNWFSSIKLAPKAVRLSDRYAWSVRMNNGMKVELGREQNANTIRELVARLLEVYPQLVAQFKTNIESIDMRYPNGLALKTSKQMSALDE